MKKKLIIMILIMLIIISFVGITQAYQATSKGESSKTFADVWIKGIRQMESAGGGLGLNEIINEESLLPSTDPNNIEVHLLKNTEYGAILILGISDYGKQGASIEDRYMDAGETTGATNQASTTGNKTGIYEMGYYHMNISKHSDYEWTAAGGSSFLPDVASRYIDRYKSDSSNADPKPGDATVETKKWHGANRYNWVGGDSNGFVRGYSGAFSYNYYDNSHSDHARAAVFVGAGL